MSTVLVLDLKAPAYEPEILDRALALASQALTKPRKMLSNALSTAITSEPLEAAGFDPTAGPGTLPLEAWIRLAERS